MEPIYLEIDPRLLAGSARFPLDCSRRILARAAAIPPRWDLYLWSPARIPGRARRAPKTPRTTRMPRRSEIGNCDGRRVSRLNDTLQPCPSAHVQMSNQSHPLDRRADGFLRWPWALFPTFVHAPLHPQFPCLPWTWLKLETPPMRWPYACNSQIQPRLQFELTLGIIRFACAKTRCIQGNGLPPSLFRRKADC